MITRVLEVKCRVIFGKLQLSEKRHFDSLSRVPHFLFLTKSSAESLFALLSQSVRDLSAL